MIKKNTKLIFEDSGKIIEDQGGIPLQKGETIKIKTKTGTKIYEITGKTIECEDQGKDLIANIAYKLKKID